MSRISLGAINKKTREYVYPKIANKKDKYICPECNRDLTIVQGKIRVHHFRHKVSKVPCHYYDHPNESQIHKDAKMLMKILLENKTTIQFQRECVLCKTNTEINFFPEVTEDSIITLEHRFNYKDELKIADVAHTLNGEIKGIYEICNTHKTCSENRPEPWVEIDANTLLRIVNTNTNTNNEPLIIKCIRCEKCEECIEKELERKRKIRSDVELKSSENESDNYSCLSKPIMEMLKDIICGDDAYKQWSGIYREMFPKEDNPIEWEYYSSDMEENIKFGYDNYNNCCDTYYNDDLIRDIQNMKLYEYLKSLYIWHGQPRFEIEVGLHYDTHDIEDKLKKLCADLFGNNGGENYANKSGGYGAVVTWVGDKYKYNDNDC